MPGIRHCSTIIHKLLAHSSCIAKEAGACILATISKAIPEAACTLSGTTIPLLYLSKLDYHCHVSVMLCFAYAYGTLKY
jgi:hypothetical protein